MGNVLKILSLKNLNKRPYIHGTSIVKGVLDELWSSFSTFSDFEIRLKKPLMYQPNIVISEIEERNPLAVVTGKFYTNLTQFYFNLIPSELSCSDFIAVDEDLLTRRVYETATDWSMDITPDDDAHVCINEVSKTSNQQLFAAQPGIVMSPKKQTWFVGCRIPSLSFLKTNIYKVGVSKTYRMLTPYCMERFILINDMIVGDRICVYA